MNAKKPLAHKDGVATLVRPLYAAGLLLEDTDLTTAVDYTRNALQLALRSLFGCGVICGLGISGKYICERRKVQIVVGAGVALDCEGNLINVPKDVTLVYDPDCKPMNQQLWVEVCYTTCESKTASAACAEEDSLTTVSRRSRDAYAIRVWESRPKCACACPPQDPEQPSPDPTDCCAGVTVTTTVETSCCGQEQTATTTTTTAPPAAAATSTGSQQEQTSLPVCACYEDHNKGKCGCECGGNCVLLGMLKMPSGDVENWQAELDARRFVRPMLLGARDCYCAECQRRDQGESESSYAYDVVRTDRQYTVGAADSLQLVRGRQIALAEKLNVNKQSLTQITADITAQKAEIVRLKQVAPGAQATDNERRAAEQALQQAERRAAELELRKERADERIKAQQAELERGEKRLERLNIERNIAAHHQELAYLDERILQRPGGKDQVLTKQREATVDALKIEVERLGKLK